MRQPLGTSSLGGDAKTAVTAAKLDGEEAVGFGCVGTAKLEADPGAGGNDLERHLLTASSMLVRFSWRIGAHIMVWSSRSFKFLRCVPLCVTVWKRVALTPLLHCARLNSLPWPQCRRIPPALAGSTDVRA
jgi:hypothetical protein